MDDLRKAAVLAALACALMPAAALAELEPAAAPDTLAPPDTSAASVVTDAPDQLTMPAAPAAKHGRAVDRSDKVPQRSPMLAMGLSAVFPGGGQLYCQRYLRAAAFAGAIGFFGYGYWREDRAMRDDVAAGNAATDGAALLAHRDSYYRHYDNRRANQWWGIGIWLFSLADAYVGAHLFKFDERAEEPAVGLRAAPGGLAFGMRF